MKLLFKTSDSILKVLYLKTIQGPFPALGTQVLGPQRPRYNATESGVIFDIG